jgi:hypothetical protein
MNPVEDDEDWTDADGVVRRVECSRCGEVRPCMWMNDPFIEEVYPESPVAPAEWCWPCYSDRRDEV